MLFKHSRKIIYIVEAAARGSLAAGVKTCCEVFFCIPDSYVIKSRKNSISGFFFEYSVKIVEIAVIHILKALAADIGTVIPV